MTHLVNFEFNSRDINGNSRCCVGQNGDISTKWYALNDIPYSQFILCEYCANNSGIKKERIQPLDFRIHKQTCSTLFREKSLYYNLDIRGMCYKGIKFNVNITDKGGDKFRPSLRVPGSDNAIKQGTLMTILPSGCYWELSLSPDPNYIWDKDTCFKLLSATFENGDKVTYRDKHGSANIYVDCDASDNRNLLVINSYSSGSAGRRFSFIAQSTQELENGLGIKDYGTSNILNLEIGIFKEIKFREPPEPKISHYRGSDRHTDPATATQTRGCSSSTFTGGACLEADGTSEYVSTTPCKSKFNELYRFPVTIQLVNNESNSQRLNEATVAQQQLETVKQAKISSKRQQIEVYRQAICNLEAEIADLSQPDRASSILLEKTNQKSFLITN